MKECIFCREGDDFTFASTLLGPKWPYRNRVVYSDSQLFAAVGVGPQVSPYILIIPYRHVSSLAELNRDEILSFRKCLLFLSKSGAFKSSICFFEHGGSSINGSSSIDHCHIHIIDNSIGLFDYCSFSNYKIFDSINDLKKLSLPYFLVGKYEDEKIVMKAAADDRQDHQYLRKVLADVQGSKYWDWRTDYRIELMIDIIKQFMYNHT